MEPTNYKVNTKSDPLKVRKTPKPDGTYTGISKEKGTIIEVTEIKNGWAKIKEGWVLEGLLLKVKQVAPIPVTPIPIVPTSTQIFSQADGRAPWMKIVFEEAKNYGGYNEGAPPLQSRIKDAYFSLGLESANSKSDPTSISWCASFASWCLQTAGFTNPRSQRALEFDPNYKFNAAKDKKSGMRKIVEPVYGCIIVWKNKSGIGGHVAFYCGRTATGQIIALGGNQGQSLQFSTRKPNGDSIQTIVGFFLPENYFADEKDKFTPDELNLNAVILNSSGLLAKKGKDSTAT